MHIKSQLPNCSTIFIHESNLGLSKYSKHTLLKSAKLAILRTSFFGILPPPLLGEVALFGLPPILGGTPGILPALARTFLDILSQNGGGHRCTVPPSRRRSGWRHCTSRLYCTAVFLCVLKCSDFARLFNGVQYIIVSHSSRIPSDLALFLFPG